MEEVQASVTRCSQHLYSGVLAEAHLPRGTDRVGSVKASRTVWVGVTSHYSHPLNSTLHVHENVSAFNIY
ncbi:unnamed protein product [Prunus armeniaca]